MAYTVPTTLAAGNILTAAVWNASVRDDILYLKDRVDNPPRALVYHNTTQSIANATLSTLQANSEISDSASLHDTATLNERMTIPAGETGWYAITAHVEWAANGTGQRQIIIYKNGSAQISVNDLSLGAGDQHRHHIALIYPLSAADWIEIWGYQTSGGALNCQLYAFSIQRIA